MKIVKMTTPHPKNQLDRVICQIRYPAILSIERDLASFQDKIKDKYPKFSTIKNYQLGDGFLSDIKDNVFKNENETLSVSVSVVALSITTNNYTNWDNFSSEIEKLFEDFSECFEVKDITRIGLRYINAIRPSSLNYAAGDIAKIIKDKYNSQNNTGFGSVVNYNNAMDVAIDDSTRAHVNYAIIQFVDDEKGFMLDTDVSTTRKNQFDDIMDNLNKFNLISRKVFCEITSEDVQKKVGI